MSLLINSSLSLHVTNKERKNTEIGGHYSQLSQVYKRASPHPQTCSHQSVPQSLPLKTGMRLDGG